MKNLILYLCLIFTVTLSAQIGNKPSYFKNAFYVGEYSEAPSSPQNSQVYYDLEDQKYYYWDGVSWKNMGGVCWIGTEAEKEALLLADPTALDDCLWICTDCEAVGGTEYTFGNGLQEVGGVVGWGDITESEFSIDTSPGLTFYGSTGILSSDTEWGWLVHDEGVTFYDPDDFNTAGQLIGRIGTTSRVGWVDPPNSTPVVNNLTSTATDEALSANQGRMLSKTTAGIYFQGENDQFAGSNFHGSIRANDVWNTGSVTELYISVFTQNPLGIQNGGMGEILENLVPGDILRIRSVENSTAILGVTVTGTPVYTDSTFDYYTVPVSQYYNTNTSFTASQWYSVDIIKNQSGVGSTNLTYNAGTRTVESDTGTDAVIPLADDTNAGLLSSYQEDDFIPTLVDVGGTRTYTLSFVEGYYIKVGQQVTIFVDVEVDTATGAGSDWLAVGNLPYTPQFYGMSASCGLGTLDIDFYDSRATTSSALAGGCVVVNYKPAAAFNNNFRLNANDFGSGDSLSFTLTYFTTE